MTEIGEIVAFVRKRVKMSSPPQYGDIRNNFAWSQTKWSKNWKEARKQLDARKPPGGGYPQYFVKDRFREQADKVLFIESLVKDSKNGEVLAIELEQEKYDESIDKYAEEIRPLFDEIGWDEASEFFKELGWVEELHLEKKGAKATLRRIINKLHGETGDTNSDKPHPLIRFGHFMDYKEKVARIKENEFKMAMLVYASCTNIRVIHSIDEPAPKLSRQDVMNLLKMLPQFVCSSPGIARKKPFHLIISFPVLAE